jgi:hypothetical protein
MAGQDDERHEGDARRGGKARPPDEHPGDDVVTLIADDVTDRLGRIFLPDEGDEEPFRTVSTFGDGGVVTGTASGGRDFIFVRWEWHGRHNPTTETNDLLKTRGVNMAPTGNPVVVQGLTAIEEGPEGSVARWFVDWLSVYAQLGVVIAGRPVGMVRTEMARATEYTTS